MACGARGHPRESSPKRSAKRWKFSKLCTVPTDFSVQLCVVLVIIWQARAVAWCACCDCCNGDNYPTCPSTTRTGVANRNGGSSPGACYSGCTSWGNYVALNGGCRWILPTLRTGLCVCIRAGNCAHTYRDRPRPCQRHTLTGPPRGSSPSMDVRWGCPI